MLKPSAAQEKGHAVDTVAALCLISTKGLAIWLPNLLAN
jgi:hypothetical protein